MAAKKQKPDYKKHPEYLHYCAECPSQGRNKIPDEGQKPCDVLVLSNYPTREDAYRRLPFAGRIGKELNYQYFPLAGISRDEAYLTYCIRCTTPNEDNPADSTYTACTYHHLHTTLAAVKPKVIVAMSAASCRVLNPNIDITNHHGRPIPTTFGRWSGTVLPVYHPSAGMGDTTRITDVREDFTALGEYLRYGKVTGDFETDPFDGIEDYQEIETINDLDTYLSQYALENPHGTKAAFDTEYEPNDDDKSIPSKLCCYSFSVLPGTGRVIMSNNTAVSNQINTWLHDTRHSIILHTATADIDPLHRMGVTYPTDCPDRIKDTAIRLYNHSLPVALKTASYRFLGMHMDEFMTLALRHSKPAATIYLETVSLAKLPKVPGFGKRPASISEKAKRILNRCRKDPDEQPWDSWGKVHPDLKQYAINAFGFIPKPFVFSFPKPVLIHYAGRDPDATLRLDNLLDRYDRSDTRGKRRRYQILDSL